jgi:molybdate-binding protein
VRERYFFALPAASLQDPLIRSVIDILQSDSFRKVVNNLAGYDATDMGKIQTIKEAFG